MVAIDTNILVRFLAQDDQAQTKRATELIGDTNVWVSLTVMLEAEWVLRRTLRIPERTVLKLLRAFAGLPNVIVEEALRLGQALDLAEVGMDFADALHLTGIDADQRFATFDLDLIRIARRNGFAEVYSP